MMLNVELAKRKIVFVVGMHGSGTSAVSGALRFCGYGHGNALMPARSDSEDGFFEQLPVVQLNTHLLTLAGSRWDKILQPLDSEKLAPVTFGTWCAENAAEAAAEAFTAAFGSIEDNVVYKDPRLALTLPLWLATAAAKGFAVEVLMVYRDVAAIIASLNRCNGIAFGPAAALVTDYWLEMLSNAPQDARVLSYSDLAADPVKALTAVGYPPLSGQEKALAAFLRAKNLNHVFARAALPAPLRNLDKALADATCGTRPDIGLLLDRTLRERHQRKVYSGDTYVLAPLAAPAKFTLRPQRRTVVLHCHIFKNAGSSVDVLLKAHFKARWAEREFPHCGISNADLVNSFIRNDVSFDALSTHTGDWWLGHSDDLLQVLPIIFLRHPLLRIRSAYGFEHKQAVDTFGAKLAKSHDFRGYVKARLDRPNDTAFRDFQARRLAVFETKFVTDLRTNAFRGLEVAPFVGLVEDFAGSAQRLQEFIAPHFEGFRGYVAHANVSDEGSKTLEEKLMDIRAELGDTVYDKLLEANAIDLALYEEARVRLTQ